MTATCKGNFSVRALLLENLILSAASSVVVVSQHQKASVRPP